MTPDLSSPPTAFQLATIIRERIYANADPELRERITEPMRVEPWAAGFSITYSDGTGFWIAVAPKAP